MADGVEYLTGFDGESRYLAARRVLRFDLAAWESWLRTCEAAWQYRQHDARERTQALLVRAQHELNQLERAMRREETAKDRDPARVDFNSLMNARGFVDRVAGLLQQHAKTGVNLPGRGPTPEATTRPGRWEPVLRLAEKGRIDVDQLRAARDLQDLIESMIAGSSARAAKFASSGGGGGFTDAVPAQLAERWSLCYVPWSRDQQRLQQHGGTRHLQLTLDIVVWQRGLRAVAAKHKIGRHRAYTIIAGALDDWLEVTHTEGRELWERRALAMAEARATAPFKAQGAEA